MFRLNTIVKSCFTFCLCAISIFLLVSSFPNRSSYSIVPNKSRIPMERQKDRHDTKEAIEALKRRITALEHRKYPAISKIDWRDQKRILITGGAGFVGSHLTDRLMEAGHMVIVADNFFTGRRRNVEHWIGHPNFELLHHDIVNPLFIEVDQIYHLASPASPPNYQYNPIKTIKTNTIGTINMLGLAKRTKSRLLLASTSEVYGNPERHPQREDYWGNVNPIGPRSCYDEGKRAAEALCYAYKRHSGIDIRVARIFNTYGPRMQINDGRVVSNFILQGLRSEPITIYGEGLQTRSFQYVSDLVTGLVSLMSSNYTLPVNLGNPDEHTISEFAQHILNLINSTSSIKYLLPAKDDPQRRKPDISIAKRELAWQPVVPLKEGLLRTIEFFNDLLASKETMKKP